MFTLDIPSRLAADFGFNAVSEDAEYTLSVDTVNLYADTPVCDTTADGKRGALLLAGAKLLAHVSNAELLALVG